MTLWNKHPVKIRGGSHSSHCAEQKALRNKRNWVSYMPHPISPQLHSNILSLGVLLCLQLQVPTPEDPKLLLKHPQLPATSPHAQQGWPSRHRRENPNRQLPRQPPHPTAGRQGLCQKLQTLQHPPPAASSKGRSQTALATGPWEENPA